MIKPLREKRKSISSQRCHPERGSRGISGVRNAFLTLPVWCILRKGMAASACAFSSDTIGGMRKLRPQQAYPEIQLRRHSIGWLARFMQAPAECVHLEKDQSWMAALLPDTLFLRGKPAPRNSGKPPRPEISLCRECLIHQIRPELAAFTGRVVAFEPEGGEFAQYFFVARPDFTAAGMSSEFSDAVSERLAQLGREPCEHERSCGRRTTWLWLPRSEVKHLDETALIRAAAGRRFCAAHGAAQLCLSFGVIEQANLLYMNLPYGDAGSYVWI
jgi:hypothetical protein